MMTLKILRKKENNDLLEMLEKRRKRLAILLFRGEPNDITYRELLKLEKVLTERKVNIEL